MHGDEAPSPWVRRWAAPLPPGACVLDVACGSGRHVRWLAAHGCTVTAIDRDAAAVESLRPLAEVIVADIENGPWPCADRRFDALVVTNYLWRPLWPQLLGALAPGGTLIYETFARGNETVGRPARPDFLLATGELLQVCSGLRIVAYEDGLLRGPERFVQRICAVREATGLPQPPRYPLAEA
jgi:SAM-dependent methyltransferase